MDNLFLAWKEFKKGKKKKAEIQEFEFNLEDNIFQLHEELESKTYQHSDYTPFYVWDPKLRHIHKAAVRDRVLHHAIFRILHPIFDKCFIYDLYSCRLGKGTHRAVLRLEKLCRKLSGNYRKSVFVLKCDIKTFFDSIDQQILVTLIQEKIRDKNTLWLIRAILKSFEKSADQGLPLGNVTSQLFANIYLNAFDQFVKRKLKIKYYIRYCDDFVLLDKSREFLISLIARLEKFLKEKLRLSIHQNKITMRNFNQGIDFLGYVVLPYHRVLRTKTKKRIFKKVNVKNLQSYLGVLKHCNGYKLKLKVLNRVL